MKALNCEKLWLRVGFLVFFWERPHSECDSFDAQVQVLLLNERYPHFPKFGQCERKRHQKY